MTQRYFAEGKCGLSIRNSSNYHVLMRNADARTNLNVANSMQLKPEITKAIDENKSKLFPYIFIDRTNQARVNGLQIFTDILSSRYQVIIGRMRYYLISEADFSSNFTVKGKNIANANKRECLRKRKITNDSSTESSEEDSSGSTSSETSSDSESRHRNKKVKRIVRRHKSSTKFLRKNK